MPFTNPDQVPAPDEKVIVGPFEAIVVDRYSIPDSVQLKIGDQLIAVPLKYLSKPVPFSNGTVYLDANGEYYMYLTVSGQPLVQGAFYAYDVDDQAYDTDDDAGFAYPSRPLRAVSFGPAISD